MVNVRYILKRILAARNLITLFFALVASFAVEVSTHEGSTLNGCLKHHVNRVVLKYSAEGLEKLDAWLELGHVN